MKMGADRFIATHSGKEDDFAPYKRSLDLIICTTNDVDMPVCPTSCRQQTRELTDLLSASRLLVAPPSLRKNCARRSSREAFAVASCVPSDHVQHLLGRFRK